MVNTVVETRPRGGRRLDPPKQRIILNLSPALAARLRKLAKTERRPLTAQIELIIERGLSRDEAAA